jgi:hypothetical protein
VAGRVVELGFGGDFTQRQFAIGVRQDVEQVECALDGLDRAPGLHGIRESAACSALGQCW